MNKFGKNKIALFLACTSVLSCKSQAAQNVKNEQTVAAVGGATSRNNQSLSQGLTKNQKLVIGAAVATLVAVPAVAFTIWGIKKHKNNDEQGQHKGNKKIKKIKKIDKNTVIDKDKLLDFFISFFSNGYELYSATDKGKVVNDTENMKEFNKIVNEVYELCKLIKNDTLEADDLKTVNTGFSEYNLNYCTNNSIKFMIYNFDSLETFIVEKVDRDDNSIKIQFNDNLIFLLKKK